MPSPTMPALFLVATTCLGASGHHVQWHDVLQKENARLQSEIGAELDPTLFLTSEDTGEAGLEADVLNLTVAALHLGLETPMAGPTREDAARVNVRDPLSVVRLIARIATARQTIERRLARLRPKLKTGSSPERALEALRLEASARFWESRQRELEGYLRDSERMVDPRKQIERQIGRERAIEPEQAIGAGDQASPARRPFL
jgi:hypothetical protein